MSIQTETARVVYAGNNSTVTPYPVPFQFLEGSDLAVIVATSGGAQTVLALNTDYTITGSGYPTPEASITTSAAVPATSTVTIYRDGQFTQTTSYVEADEFPAASHERALDKGIMLDQQLEEARQRAFRLTVPSPMLPALIPVNNALLGLDPAGVPLFKTASEVLSWLSLVQTVFNFPTKTFLNAAERAIAVPDFLGQVGTQRDTNAGYIGTALTAGSWSPGVSSVADGAITTAKLANGALSADAAGRIKMAAAFLMASHANADLVSGQTADTLLDDTDSLLGYNGAALRKYAGNVVVPPGSIIQTVSSIYTANDLFTLPIPLDDTIPQIGEGSPMLSLNIAPRFADSTIRVMFKATGAMAGNGNAICALFRNTISNAIASDLFGISGGAAGNFLIDCFDSPATTSTTTYTIRVGPGTVGAIRLNGNQVQRYLGGSMAATLVAQEIKV